MQLVFFGLGDFFGFWTLASYATKNWSNKENSKIPEFSILGIGQNRKRGNLDGFHFFLLNHKF